MSDNRSKRKNKIIPFVNIQDDRKHNLDELVKLAKQLKLEGFMSVVWQDASWVIDGGRLIKKVGSRRNKIIIKFKLTSKLGNELLTNDWGEVAKALFVLRFHQKNQVLTSQLNFINAIGYISYAANQLNQSLFQITPEALDNACVVISQHYSAATAYNIHKAVGEFAAHCDSNGLCRNFFDYKYSGMKRPQNTGGIKHQRLDEAEIIKPTKSEKMVRPEIYKIIGELYLNVPKDHKYRFYVLLLSMLLLTGRRFSEISLLPLQEVNEDKDGKFYIQYFPVKNGSGDNYTPLERLYLPTTIVSIVREIIKETVELTKSVRETAIEIQKVKGADLRFLDTIPDDRKIYSKDLVGFNLSRQLLYTNKLLRRNNQAWSEIQNNQEVFYTYKEGLKTYCAHYFEPQALEVIRINQQGKEYFLADLLFIRNLGLSSGAYAHWLVTNCTHTMISNFLRQFSKFSEEYASSSTECDFSTHHFRHTMNTLLDEGGLSELLQTEWFGRSNPVDTKAYQHTDPAKRVLMLRADIKKGSIGGKLAEQVKLIPIEYQDAVLKARVQAVHDVGTGLCIHNFSQMPCEKHLQCSADCKDYVWVKNDTGRIEEIKRLYSMAIIARTTAEEKSKSKKPKKSIDWMIHNEKKIKTLEKQMSDYSVEYYDPFEYLKEIYDE